MKTNTADRTLHVFEGFAEIGRPATLSELARYLEIPVSSCSGLLKTLERRGYLHAVEPRSTYYPTNRLLQVARGIADHDPLTSRIAPVLEALRDETGETVVLAKRREDKVLFLDVVESRSNIRYVAQVGEVRLLHASSLGKALLSVMSEAERASVFRRLEFRRLTPKTLATPKALEASIAADRRLGCYVNFGESVPDLYAIARPLIVDGKAYAIAVIGPGKRIEDKRKRLFAALAKACKAVPGSDPRPRA
jgi:DNA-binding IclR family transcriptional regulator